MALARRVSEQVLADRAIDGVEEEIWHRGEFKGTKRKLDGRLLLAHLGRLDKAVTEDAERDADRFDELLAVIAGEVNLGSADPDDVLPPDREDFVSQAIEAAENAVLRSRKPKYDESGAFEDQDEAIACRVEIDEACVRACHAASCEWDDWRARAANRVDTILGGCTSSDEGGLGFSARTLSTASTPALARALGTSGESGPEGHQIISPDA